MSYLRTELSNSSGVERRRARVALVELGDEAVPTLIAALSDPHLLAKHEALKALEAIGNVAAAQGLVDALHDSDYCVRWMAAEALTHTGPTGLRILLAELAREDELGSEPAYVHEWTRYVLHFYQGDLPKPLEQLLSALDDNGAGDTLAWDASVALQSITITSTTPSSSTSTTSTTSTTSHNFSATASGACG